MKKPAHFIDSWTKMNLMTCSYLSLDQVGWDGIQLNFFDEQEYSFSQTRVVQRQRLILGNFLVLLHYKIFERHLYRMDIL